MVAGFSISACANTGTGAATSIVNAATEALIIKVFMIPLLGLNVPWANRPRKRWAARRAVQCLGGFAWRNQAKMLGGCCSGWADRPSRAAITGQARNAAPGIASATIGCHMPTVNRIEQQIGRAHV